MVKSLFSTSMYSCIHKSVTVTKIPATKEELHLETLNQTENTISL